MNTVTIQKGHAPTAILHQRTVRGIFQQNVARAVRQPLATIREPRPHVSHTYKRQRTHVGAVTRLQHSVSRTQTGP